ncbi:MAG: DUF1822 family protein [Cyanobacteria bacterium P01_G01_bin.39]
MNPLELFPEASTWKINKLIDDLNATRKQFDDNKGEISEMQKNYLCGALAGYSPKKISQKLGLKGDGKKIRTTFSTEINPYIQELLEYPDDFSKSMNWQRACVLLEKAGYKNFSSSPDNVAKLKIDLDRPSMADVESILAMIRQVSGDELIVIKDIRRGCIELVLSGSSEGLKRLKSLVKSGELTEINGVKIISVESEVEPSKVIRLSNWWDNLVESGWSALEQFLSPQQLELATVRSSNVSKGKLIDRTMIDGGFAVVLTLQPEKLADGSFDVVLRLYPTGEQDYLPSGIELRMFGQDEDGNQVGTDVRAGDSDEWLQLNFTGESGEEFSIEIVQENISVIENFVI